LLSKHQPNAGAYNESGTFGARKVLDDWSLLGRDKESEKERGIQKTFYLIEQK